jgi:hypothetical protein
MTLLTKASILLDVGTLVCLIGWLAWAHHKWKDSMPKTDPRDGVYSRLLDTPNGPHRWSVDYEMKDTTVAQQWVERFPTGLGWARCSCGVRVEGPDGKAIPLDLAHLWLGKHLTEARNAGEHVAQTNATPPTTTDAVV